ncbi:hypothetical protein EDD15DRAFT_2226779 [Pisolithus albus]|nr:hypothetical protein EDD15DRAFT_2226779 [Pisolithus albus]
MGIPGNFGCILITGLISCMVYGITILQAYIYYMHYANDTSIVKFLVAAICVLDTLHVAFMCHLLYHYLVKPKRPLLVTVVLKQLLQIINYGVPASVEYIVWSFPVRLLISTTYFQE